MKGKKNFLTLKLFLFQPCSYNKLSPTCCRSEMQSNASGDRLVMGSYPPPPPPFSMLHPPCLPLLSIPPPSCKFFSSQAGRQAGGQAADPPRDAFGMTLPLPGKVWPAGSLEGSSKWQAGHSACQHLRVVPGSPPCHPPTPYPIPHTHQRAGKAKEEEPAGEFCVEKGKKRELTQRAVWGRV